MNEIISMNQSKNKMNSNMQTNEIILALKPESSGRNRPIPWRPLASCVVESSETMTSSVQNQHVTVFHGKGFQIHTHFSIEQERR